MCRMTSVFLGGLGKAYNAEDGNQCLATCAPAFTEPRKCGLKGLGTIRGQQLQESSPQFEVLAATLLFEICNPSFDLCGAACIRGRLDLLDLILDKRQPSQRLPGFG